MKSQQNKIFELLKLSGWHCVNEFIDTYCVDYRRRLKDLQEKGYQLENRRCQNPNHKHSGGSKQWRIKPESIITKTYRVLDDQGKVEKEFNVVRYGT